MVTKTDLKKEFLFKEEDGNLYRRYGNVVLVVKATKLMVRSRIIMDLDYVTKKELRAIINRIINANV
jgi:hypothetical protein